MYLGVLGLLFLGACVTRFSAKGMTRVLAATAAAQMAVPVIALTVWEPRVTDVVRALGPNAFFAVLWIGAAALFWHAAETRRQG